MIEFKLNQVLKRLNMSRNKFSVLSGVRPNTINDMCNGDTKRLEVETLNIILKHLNHLSHIKLNISDLIEFREDEIKNATD